MSPEPITAGGESLEDMTLDVRELRAHVARGLVADLTPAEVRNVAEVAAVILSMSVAERACLFVILREEQTRTPAE